MDVKTVGGSVSYQTQSTKLLPEVYWADTIGIGKHAGLQEFLLSLQLSFLTYCADVVYLDIALGNQQTGQAGLPRVMETSSRIAMTEANVGVCDGSPLTHCSINLQMHIYPLNDKKIL